MSYFSFPLDAGFFQLLQLSGQASLAVLLVFAVRALLGNCLPARWRHLLWALVLLRLIIPLTWFPTSLASLENLTGYRFNINSPSSAAPIRPQLFYRPEMSEIQLGTLPTPVPRPANSKHFLSTNQTKIAQASEQSKQVGWLQVSALVWLLGFGIGISLTLAAQLRLMARVSRQRRPLPLAISAEWDAICADLALVKRPNLIVSSALTSPVLLGFWRPWLVLPTEAVTSYSRREREHIFAHELAHFHRADHWSNALQINVLCLHWFNPLVWLSYLAARFDQELAADEWALTRLEASTPQAYGQTLVKIVVQQSSRNQFGVALAMSENASGLKHRLHRIVAFGRHFQLSSLLAGLIIGALAVLLLTRGTKPATVVLTPEEALAARSTQIGVGTWATSAEFKDLKVSDGATTKSFDLAKGFSDWTLLDGSWQIKNGAMQQTEVGGWGLHAITNGLSKPNYTFSLKARKLRGVEGFLIYFRYADENDLIWWNIGGWLNTRTQLERIHDGYKYELGEPVPQTLQTNKWYEVRIEVTGNHFKCFLDNKLVSECDDQILTSPTAGSDSEYQQIISARNDLNALYKPNQPVNAVTAQNKEQLRSAYLILRIREENFIADYPNDPRVWQIKSESIYTHLANPELGLPGLSPEEARQARETLANDPKLPIEQRRQEKEALIMADLSKEHRKVTAQVPDFIKADREISQFEDEFGIKDNDSKSYYLREIELEWMQNDTQKTAIIQTLRASRYPNLVKLAQQEENLQKAKTTPIDLKFTGLDGKPFDLAKMRGKVVLIDFWATWCGFAQGETPNVLAAYNKYHAQGLEVVGISLDQDKAALEKYINDNKLVWPQYFDGKGWGNGFSGQYPISGIPVMWLINKDGLLVTPHARSHLDSLIPPLLQQKA